MEQNNHFLDNFYLILGCRNVFISREALIKEKQMMLSDACLLIRPEFISKTLRLVSLLPYSWAAHALNIHP